MIYKNARINGEITDIEVSDGKISKIGRTDGTGVDLGGLKVIPGLIDIHSHGCMGYDTMDGKNLVEMSRYIASQGVTSWLPTTMTESFCDIKAVTNIEIPETGGAEVLGFHAEGPYISEKYKGAQNADFIKSPDISEFKTLKNVKMVTIAPELCGADDFIREISKDTIISIGHTDADYDCSKNAIKNGALCLTHTFNAMSPLHHRNPGPIGAAFDENIYVQVICDGLHIHGGVIRMLYKLFGAERMILISDSMRATGLPDGDYEFGGQTVTVKNSVARTQDGAIAGSTSTLMTCLKCAIKFGIPECDAVKMATSTPAKLLGIKKGVLKEGYDADFVALDDNMNVVKCIIGGKEIQ